MSFVVELAVMRDKETQMDRLVDKLNHISESVRIEDFEWEIPSNCPIEIPLSLSSGYEKNVYLKSHFHEHISNDEDLSSHYWVIQEWGGIGSFKKNERNDRRINKFIQELLKEKLTKDSFSCISSLSKVASFIEPEKYVIYDSRVIYSLNWLLFNLTDEQSLFPQPAGRSASLAKYDMQTIFRLTKREVTYRSHKVAFHEYCSFVRMLAPLVFGKGVEPYKLEMLLFMIAPTWVVNNIESSVSIEISSFA